MNEQRNRNEFIFPSILQAESITNKNNNNNNRKRHALTCKDYHSDTPYFSAGGSILHGSYKFYLQK